MDSVGWLWSHKARAARDLAHVQLVLIVNHFRHSAILRPCVKAFSIVADLGVSQSFLLGTSEPRHVLFSRMHGVYRTFTRLAQNLIL